MTVSDAEPHGQGVIPVHDSHTVCKIKGQHKSLAHCDRSSRVGQAWGRHSIIDTFEGSSRLTGEPIKVNVIGPVECCRICGVVPRWDREGNLACECRIWSGRSEKTTHEGAGVALNQIARNQNYQRNLRKFFKTGGRC